MIRLAATAAVIGLALAGCDGPRRPDTGTAARLIAERAGTPVTVVEIESEPGGLWRVTWQRDGKRGVMEHSRLRHWDGRWRLVVETDTAERLRLL